MTPSPPSAPSAAFAELDVSAFESAKLMLELLESTPAWIRRQVDSLDFHGVDRFTRRVSLDIVPPAGPLGDGSSTGERHVAVPLGVFSKGTLANFDARDEAGVPLPVLTKHQNEILGQHVLASLWSDAGAGPDVVGAQIVEHMLGALPGAPPSMARAIWWDLFENTHTRGVPAIAQARTSGRLRRVANLFAHSFVLQALVQVGPGHSRRTVIKFCLEQSADTSAGIRSIASSDRSLRPGVVAQADLGLGFAESHHVEVAAPVGMRIMEMIVLEPLAEGDMFGVAVHDRLLGARAHVVIPVGALEPPETGGGSTEPGRILVVYEPERSLLHLPAFVVSTTVFLVLVIGLCASALFDLRPTSDSSSAILLLVPGLAATVYARPGRHPLISSTLATPRYALSVAAIAAVLAAASISVEPVDRVIVDHESGSD